MAIGQLADYARFVSPEPQRAILLPEEPRLDLRALLESAGIRIIWRSPSGFVDAGER
jgi:hypothetical protein